MTTATRPVPPALAKRARDTGYLTPMLDGVTLGLLHYPSTLTPVHVAPITWGVMLDDLPTITQGHTADLKYDSGERGRIRVWSSRMTRADGALSDFAAEVEHLNHLGRWVEAGTCSPDFDGSRKLPNDPHPLMWSAYVWTYWTWLNLPGPRYLPTACGHYGQVGPNGAPTGRVWCDVCNGSTEVTS